MLNKVFSDFFNFQQKLEKRGHGLSPSEGGVQPRVQPVTKAYDDCMSITTFMIDFITAFMTGVYMIKCSLIHSLQI